MSDLVKRLRKRWDWSNDEATTNDMIDERAEAADRIEALEAAVARADALAEACDNMADAVNSTSADAALTAYRQAREATR